MSIKIEEHMQKHLDFALEPFCENGMELAKFLFAQYDSPNSHYAAAIYHHIMSLEKGVDSIETAIIDHLCENHVANTCGQDSLPPISSAEFFALVEGTDATSDNKLAALHLYHNFDMYHGYLKALLANAKELYHEACPGPEIVVAPMMAALKNGLKKEGGAYVKQILGIVPSPNDRHILYPSIYRINTFAASAVHGTNIVVCEIGVHLMVFIHLAKPDNMAEEFLKCISDKSKRKIMQLLKKGPMYGGQLAKELDCTTANISHHLNRMLAIGIIRMENDNNRLYAHLEQEKIHGYLDGLKDLF